jgi:hypothetical protein
MQEFFCWISVFLMENCHTVYGVQVEYAFLSRKGQDYAGK